jgi:F-type H+-transporting ATPase subunit b|tara:strand:+ start:177 stop:740 length:564 start_codon:yes stop_codon:yes gene_type:complete
MTMRFLTAATVLIAGTSAAWAAGEGESLLESAQTWVAVAFVIFLVAIYRPVTKMMASKLDGRAEEIKSELDEAQRLREEAQHTLAEYQRKQRDALAEAEGIIAEACEEAKRIDQNVQERTEATLKRREQQALDMIAAAEARAIADVRALAADVAISATRQILTDAVDGQKGDEIVDQAIGEIPGKLN